MLECDVNKSVLLLTVGWFAWQKLKRGALEAVILLEHDCSHSIFSYSGNLQVTFSLTFCIIACSADSSCICWYVGWTSILSCSHYYFFHNFITGSGGNDAIWFVNVGYNFTSTSIFTSIFELFFPDVLTLFKSYLIFLSYYGKRDNCPAIFSTKVWLRISVALFSIKI